MLTRLPSSASSVRRSKPKRKEQAEPQSRRLCRFLKMMQKRVFISALGAAAALAFTGGYAASMTRSVWSESAFRAAHPAALAVRRHPFITGVFVGTLKKSAFVSYLEQNLFYLSNYARMLDVVAGRLKKISGFGNEAEDFARWAQETRDLRVWTKEFASTFVNRPIEEKALRPAPETLAYIGLEKHCAMLEDLCVAAAAMLPCFWVYDDFGRALRAGARLEGNPYREWVEPLGTKEAHDSALRAAAAVDRLAEKASKDVLARMSDVFVAGCWHEWSLFEAACRGS